MLRCTVSKTSKNVGSCYSLIKTAVPTQNGRCVYCLYFLAKLNGLSLLKKMELQPLGYMKKVKCVTYCRLQFAEVTLYLLRILALSRSFGCSIGILSVLGTFTIKHKRSKELINLGF